MSDKIKPHHLERKAVLYVRQSSSYQVTHNEESGRLQYAMRDRLTSYAFLFRQHSSLPEEALEIRSLIKTKQPRVEYHRFARRTQAHFQRLFAIIRAYLDALDSGNYFIRPNHLCAACEFSHSHCREWTG